MRHPLTCAALLASLMSAVGTLHAEDRHEERTGREQRVAHPAREVSPHLLLDSRYHHDQWYPRRGEIVDVLPVGSVHAQFHGSPFWFAGGVWLRADGARFVVAEPPVGIVVPALPPAAVTLTIGGAPYYYANEVYYATVPGRGYAVVAPPTGAEAAAPTAPTLANAVPPALIAYPRNGQSAGQTADDRRECNGWAAAQPGAAASPQVFERAAAACLEGRGYTVR